MELSRGEHPGFRLPLASKRELRKIARLIAAPAASMLRQTVLFVRARSSSSRRAGRSPPMAAPERRRHSLSEDHLIHGRTQSHHHLRGHRLDLHAVDVAASADHREEIAEAAIGAAEAGAAIVHLHARDPEDGRPDQ